jgi:4-hydroxyacetophenone monooxygenase
VTGLGRNPHSGEPFADLDDAIAAALEDVSVPALLCSLVHMTGDPSWIRGVIRPRAASFDVQLGLSPEEQVQGRRLALPAVAAYRDRGCVPEDFDPDLLGEMMAFLGGRPVPPRVQAFFLEDLHFDGADGDAVKWAGEVPEAVKADCRVVVIGCGMAGILAGIRLRQARLPFLIIEKSGGPGGTWWDNRYPGARVDVGSHQYCYSFEPADHWSEYYCRQAELQAYFERIIDKYQLRSSARFATSVTAMRWDERAGRWLLTTRGSDGSEEIITARFVISAVGSLNLPKLPEIPGMEDFAGPSFHSSRWPQGLDVTGTRFALIGAGASGFQIAPAIAGMVEQLTIFQRTAQWMLPNPMYHRAVPPGDRWALRHLPFYGRWLRFIMTFSGVAAGTEGFRIDPAYTADDGLAVNDGHAGRKDLLLRWLLSFLDDRPDLVDKVVPDYPAMGKRILQDDGTWLRTLKLPNVELVRTGIDHIERDAVVTVDGIRHPADAMCYATGFRHNEYLAPMEVIGRKGASLRRQWGEEPSAYLGITVPNFPNLFILYGPGTNLAHSASLFLHAEFQVHYTMESIRQVLARGARTIEVRTDVHDDYLNRYQEEIGQLIWSHPSITHSHYKNADGRIFTLWPWSVDQYWEWTREVDPDDYVIS